MKAKHVIIIIILLLLGIFSFKYVRDSRSAGEVKEQVKKDSVFSWEDSTLHEIKRVQLEVLMEKMGAGRLFQSFSAEVFESNTMYDFMEKMAESNLEVYYLAGDANWALEGGIEIMKAEVDKVAAWNNAEEVNGSFAGIMFDVEPYLLEEWDNDEQGFFLQYSQMMKTVYSYAKEKKIKMLMCIPYWYDEVNQEVLEDIIANACDETAVMNYNREDELHNIENELQYARKYDKEITCIFEFIEAGKHSLEEINTYNAEGIDAGLNSMKKLKEAAAYDKLYGSYHYFKPLVELLEAESFN